MSEIKYIHLYLLLQQLAQAHDPIRKISILRELAVYVYDKEELENIVSDLSDAELELHTILPRLREDLEEIEYGNKDYIDEDLREAYKVTMSRLAVLEQYIIEEIMNLSTTPTTVEP